jgi:PAS domain S-box-containing protein
LTQVFGAVKDITARKQAEKEFLNSESRFRELLENVNLIAVVLDANGKVSFCNNYLLKITGYKEEELIGADWFDFMIPSQSPGVKEIFLSGLKNGNIDSRYENPIVTKNGKLLNIIWSNTVQKNADGSVSGIASIGEDVTERKVAEEKINNLNKQLEQRVAERTLELEEKNAELSRMNRLFVGRELRMVELKKRIKELIEQSKSI